MSRTNRLLSAALAIQVVLLVATRMFGGDEGGKVKPKKIWPNLTVDKVKRVEIVDGKGKKAVLARKADSSWVLASGGDYPADKEKVDKLISKLPGLKAGEPVTTKKEHHRKLEVAKDKFQRKVTVGLTGGKKLEFFIGSSPLVQRVHFRLAGKDAVYAVADLSAWDINTSATSWVDSEYFKVDDKQIRKLELKNSHGTIALSKDGDGNWQLADAKDDEKLAKSEVDSLVSTISTINLQQPVGKQVEPSYELAKPQAEVTLAVLPAKGKDGAKGKEKGKGTDKDGAKGGEAGQGKPAGGETEGASSQPAAQLKTYRLRVGAKVDDDFYFQSSSSPYVVRVAKWTAETLVDKKRADLLEKPDDDKKEGGGPSTTGPGSTGARPMPSIPRPPIK